MWPASAETILRFVQDGWWRGQTAITTDNATLLVGSTSSLTQVSGLDKLSNPRFAPPPWQHRIGTNRIPNEGEIQPWQRAPCNRSKCPGSAGGGVSWAGCP